MSKGFQLYYPDKSFHLFDRMVEQNQHFYYIQTTQAETLAQRLATYQEYTGRVTYQWHDESGLRRYDIPHIVIPRTQNLLNAISHISQNNHFGIHLFTGFGDALQKPMALNVLDAYLNTHHNDRKILIFADPNPSIPREMNGAFQELRDGSIMDNSPPPLQPLKAIY